MDDISTGQFRLPVNADVNQSVFSYNIISKSDVASLSINVAQHANDVGCGSVEKCAYCGAYPGLAVEHGAIDDVLSHSRRLLCPISDSSSDQPSSSSLSNAYSTTAPSMFGRAKRTLAKALTRIARTKYSDASITSSASTSTRDN